MDTKTVGVIVGRFQVDMLTSGHLDLFKKVMSLHKDVIVVLGDHPVRSYYNPLSVEARVTMIQEEFTPKESARLYFTAIKDCKSDEVWSANLDATIDAAIYNIGYFETRDYRPVVLYGGRDSFIPRYSGKLETTFIPTTSSESGTQRRESINRYRPTSENMASWRQGVIYALQNQFEKVHPTVDIALVRRAKGGYQVLLGRKPNEPFWRFPGGFVSPNDHGFEDSARRELQEETSLISEGDFTQIANIRISDWRYPVSPTGDTREAVITTFYIAPYSYGKESASDDLEKCSWFFVNEAEPIIGSVHKELLSILSKYLQDNPDYLPISDFL